MSLFFSSFRRVAVVPSRQFHGSSIVYGRRRRPSARPELSRTRSHRRALMRNQVTQLIRHERIVTTLAKAKQTSRWAERMVTYAKRGTLASRRLALAFVQEEAAVHKLFNVLGPRFETRPGGYTRVRKLGRRRGDDAMMAYIEYLGDDERMPDENAFESNDEVAKGESPSEDRRVIVDV